MHQNFQSMMLNQGLERNLKVWYEGLLYQVSILYFRDGPKSCISLHTPVPIKNADLI